MKPKFFRPKSLNTGEIPVGKVKISVPEKPTVADDDILAKIAKMEGKLKLPTKLPPRPPKRKAKKRTMVGGTVEFSSWAPAVKAWGEKIGNVITHFEDDVDRVDVIGDGWRICVMGFIGQEFTVTLFWDYDTGYNSKRINVEYIKQNSIMTALDYVYGSRELFKGEAR